MPATVLLAHNAYKWPGGEDTAYGLDGALLERHGHRVVRYQRDNDEIDGYGARERAGLALRTIWARDTARDIAALVARERPDVAHFHNTFPLISPAAFGACADAGVPVVLTMPNFRLGCLNSLLYRDGRVCEDCLGRTVKWPGVVHACYRDSRPQSAVVATMLAVHGVRRTWTRFVDAFVSVSEFGRGKLVEAGVPGDRIHVRPNYLDPDPGGRSRGTIGERALFVGRLSEEKGVRVLAEAWRRLADAPPLTIVGDGPLRAEIEAAAVPGITLAGARPHDEVLSMMRTARYVVVPSTCYENFPMTVVEAMACGVPVIASDLGALADVVPPEIGRRFAPGDASTLAQLAVELWCDAPLLEQLGQGGRRRFEAEYTADRAYERLVSVYRSAGEITAARAG